MITLLIAVAVAAPAYEAPAFEMPGGNSGTRLPGATPIEAGHGAIGAFGSAYGYYRVGFATTDLRAAYGITDRLSFELGGGRIAEPSSSSPYYDFGTLGETTGTIRLQLGGDGVRVTPWVRSHVALVRSESSLHKDPALTQSELGLAFEAGGERTRIDASVAAVCLTTFLGTESRAPAITPCLGLSQLPEFGLSFLLGANSRVRVGGLYPTVSYGYFSEVAFAEVGLGVLGATGRVGLTY